MATRSQPFLGALTLLLLFVAVGCPPVQETRDDDTIDDDDSAADDDSQGDDDTGATCSAPPPPYTFEFTGNHSGTFVFDDFACTDYNGDEWSLSYLNSSGWHLRVVAGPLAEGESLGPGTDPAKIDITLQNNSKQAVYSGRLSLGHVANIEVQRYQSPSGPCGWLTTDALQSSGPTAGSVSITPQPIPFNCPN
jgi:hypothetical protein